MTIRLAGAGQQLPLPQALHPSPLHGVAFSPPTNYFNLSPGAVVVIPAGEWLVQSFDGWTMLEFFDPIEQVWVNINIGTITSIIPGPDNILSRKIYSDGVNLRMKNVSGTGIIFPPILTAGSGYDPATTRIVPSMGNSVWRAYIGGAVGAFTIVNPGSGHTIAPTVYIDAPPVGGTQAGALATINAAGAVTGISLSAALGSGGGYTTPPRVTVVPSPNDPNIDRIEPAEATCTLTGAGTLVGAACSEWGQPLTARPTLTVIGGGGTGATLGNINGFGDPAGTWDSGTNTDTVLLQPA